MRILIVYFSGTGNTARIAQLLQKEALAQDTVCEIMPMEQITLGQALPDFHAWDLIGIGFPVHAMDAPQIVYDFLKLLPKGRIAYFLYKTAGSPMLKGGSSYRIRESLSNLGWRLRHEQLYVMPPNAFGTANPRKIAKRYQQCQQLVKESISEILSGIKRLLPDPSLSSLCYQFAALEKHGAKQSSRRWTVNQNCNQCGLCVAQCPAANIHMEEGKLIFEDKCLLCLRCWWICPQRAISHSFLKPFFLKEPYCLPEL